MRTPLLAAPSSLASGQENPRRLGESERGGGGAPRLHGNGLARTAHGGGEEGGKKEKGEEEDGRAKWTVPEKRPQVKHFSLLSYLGNM